MQPIFPGPSEWTQPWFVENVPTHDGVAALQSGAYNPQPTVNGSNGSPGPGNFVLLVAGFF